VIYVSDVEELYTAVNDPKFSLLLLLDREYLQLMGLLSLTLDTSS
jgi:hypothetical protein